MGLGEGLNPGMIGFFRRTGEFEGVFIVGCYSSSGAKVTTKDFRTTPFGDKTAQFISTLMMELCKIHRVQVI